MASQVAEKHRKVNNITYNINKNGIIPNLYSEIGLQMVERSYKSCIVSIPNPMVYYVHKTLISCVV